MFLIASLQERIESLTHLRGSVVDCGLTIESLTLRNHGAKQDQLFSGCPSDSCSDVLKHCRSEGLVLPTPKLLPVANIRRMERYRLVAGKILSLNSVESLREIGSLVLRYSHACQHEMPILWIPFVPGLIQVKEIHSILFDMGKEKATGGLRPEPQKRRPYQLRRSLYAMREAFATVD